MYWIPKQINAKTGGRIAETDDRLTGAEQAFEISQTEWDAVMNTFNNRFDTHVIMNDPLTNRPKVFERTEPTSEALLRELSELKAWFSKYSYISEKIATGRATVAEYKPVISQMDGKAERINQIRAELDRRGVTHE